MSYECCGDDGRVAGDSAHAAALRNALRLARQGLRDLVHVLVDSEQHSSWPLPPIALVTVVIVVVGLLLPPYLLVRVRRR